MLSTSTSPYVSSGLSTSTEIRYSSTTSTSTKYSGPNPDLCRLETNCKFVPTWEAYLSRLPWIFLEDPLKVNRAPGNIQGNLPAEKNRIRTQLYNTANLCISHANLLLKKMWTQFYKCMELLPIFCLIIVKSSTLETGWVSQGWFSVWAQPMRDVITN